MDETDWSQWFTLDENGEPVFAEGMTGSNKALATEKYYEYLNMAVNEKVG